MMAFLLMPDSTNCYPCLRTGVTNLSSLYSRFGEGRGGVGFNRAFSESAR
jgi:hypothetical protein